MSIFYKTEDADLHRQVKRAALDRGVTLRQAVETALRLWLASAAAPPIYSELAPEPVRTPAGVRRELSPRPPRARRQPVSPRAPVQETAPKHPDAPRSTGLPFRPVPKTESTR
jgi:hypothetical protein